MRVSTARALGAVGSKPAAFALGAANGGDGATLAAAGSCTRKTGGEFTCEEASGRDRNAHVGQLSGKCFHNKASRDHANRNAIVVIEVLKVKNLSSSRKFLERAHATRWAPFVSKIDRNLEKVDSHLIKIDPGDTSQDCSGSGETAKKSLSVRTPVSPGCEIAQVRAATSAASMLNNARTVLASPAPSAEKRLGAEFCAT